MVLYTSHSSQLTQPRRNAYAIDLNRFVFVFSLLMTLCSLPLPNCWLLKERLFLLLKAEHIGRVHILVRLLGPSTLMHIKIELHHPIRELEQGSWSVCPDRLDHLPHKPADKGWGRVEEIGN